MKYLVTGGYGFIGSHVVSELFKDEDNEIVVVDCMTIGSDLKNISEEIVKSDRFEKYIVDISDWCTLRAVFSHEKPDVVLHLAAESHVDRSLSNPSQFVHTNFTGTHNVLMGVLMCDSRLVHVSTDEVYGQLGENDLPFLETNILDPRSPYSASKAASDLLVLSYIKSYDIDATITRCCNNYGPNQHSEKLIPTIISSLRENRKVPIYGKGDNIREWIYVDDHAKAIIEISKFPGDTFHLSNHIRNIPGKISMSNLEMVKYIWKAIGTETFEDSIEFVEDRKGHDFRYEIDTIYRTQLKSVKYQLNFDLGMIKTLDYYLNS